MPQLLLDANMIVVFVVGGVAPNLLGKAKRVKEYQPGDYDLLYTYISLFTDIVLLPNTLTEASNLLSQMTGTVRDDAMIFLAALIGGTERYVPSAIAVVEPEFAELGLTDAAIMSVLGRDTCLLTADHDLYVAALQRARDVQYFEYLR